MNEEITFTIEELLEALTEKPNVKVDGAYTVHQLKRLMPNKSKNTIRAALRGHIEAGNMECVMVTYERIDGIRTRVPAYRLVDKGNHGDGQED